MKKIKVLAISDFVSHRNVNPIRPEAAQLIGAHNSDEVEVTVLCSPGSMLVDYYGDHGIQTITHPVRKKLSWDATHFIRRQLKDGKYDVLHLFNSKAISNGANAAIGLPVKVIAYRGQTGSIKRYDPMSYLNMLHPRIDKIICVAQAVENDLRKQLWGSSDKLVTIYKGHDLSWYQNPPADLSGLELPDDAVTLSLVANLRPRKGLHVLMEATHHIDSAIPLHILLVGTSLDDPELQKQVAAAAFPERAHALGYRDDAPEVSGASDMIVLPTTKREGLSRAILEGMAYGRPAVVTSTGGNAELVADGESGFVVPPNDPVALGKAIEKLARDKALRERFGAEAKRRIQMLFNVEQGVAKTLEVYRELAA